MSTTPRTDAEESIQTQRYGCYMVKSDFARQLETELNEAKLLLDKVDSAAWDARIAELAEAIEDSMRLQMELNADELRINQLETALRDAISTYKGSDKLVTAERIEAWESALAGDKPNHDHATEP